MLSRDIVTWVVDSYGEVSYSIIAKVKIQVCSCCPGHCWWSSRIFPTSRRKRSHEVSKRVLKAYQKNDTKNTWKHDGARGPTWPQEEPSRLLEASKIWNDLDQHRHLFEFALGSLLGLPKPSQNRTNMVPRGFWKHSKHDIKSKCYGQKCEQQTCPQLQT